MAEPNTIRSGCWLVLATDGPASRLPALPGRTAPHVVEDAAVFSRALVEERPRVALAARPPANDAVVAEMARERRRRPVLRIVLVTAPADVSRRLAALEAGFDDAVADSISPFELACRLALLDDRSRRTSTSTILPVTDEAELDLVAHELRRNGGTVHLRPKEFALLAMLAAHPGRAYSRRQLLDRVWGTGHLGDPRTVDVHVRWLRSKVEPDPEHPAHLITVRGVGYRLDSPERQG